MANKWISFLKSWRVKNKGVSMKDSMKRAAVEYKKGKSSDEKPKKRRKAKKKKT